MAKEILEKIEKLMNRILKQDEVTLNAIGELKGKVIAIYTISPDFMVYLKFDGTGVTIKKEYGGRVDVTIKARPVTLLIMLLAREEKVTPRDMEIIGDVGLAQRFQSIMKNIEIDWEENLSHRIGDFLAHKLGNLFRNTRKYVNETRDTIEMDISEYLRYEKEILVDLSEVDEFITVIDVIRDDMERLRQRVKRLERKIISSV
ncbi:MAG: SCP2 sterol-binding domain-containing protein [Gammaproteobacteria bacterium]|nr:SCP2 sterol-binding domain-containing protein [Gammaproteobacteria bacterium]